MQVARAVRLDARTTMQEFVVPANAGTQWRVRPVLHERRWVPACAGTTGMREYH